MAVLIWLLIVFHGAAFIAHCAVGFGMASWTLTYNGIVGLTLVVILAKLFL